MDLKLRQNAYLGKFSMQPTSFEKIKSQLKQFFKGSKISVIFFKSSRNCGATQYNTAVPKSPLQLSGHFEGFEWEFHHPEYFNHFKTLKTVKTYKLMKIQDFRQKTQNKKIFQNFVVKIKAGIFGGGQKWPSSAGADPHILIHTL